jgi:hypothetical protein
MFSIQFILDILVHSRYTGLAIHSTEEVRRNIYPSALGLRLHFKTPGGRGGSSLSTQPNFFLGGVPPPRIHFPAILFTIPKIQGEGSHN